MHFGGRKPEEVIIRFDASRAPSLRRRRESISRGNKGHSMNWNLAATGPTQRRVSLLHSIDRMVVEMGQRALARTDGIVASALLAGRQSLKFGGYGRTESSALRLGVG